MKSNDNITRATADVDQTAAALTEATDRITALRRLAYSRATAHNRTMSDVEQYESCGEPSPADVLHMAVCVLDDAHAAMCVALSLISAYEIAGAESGGKQV